MVLEVLHTTKSGKMGPSAMYLQKALETCVVT